MSKAKASTTLAPDTLSGEALKRDHHTAAILADLVDRQDFTQSHLLQAWEASLARAIHDLEGQRPQPQHREGLELATLKAVARALSGMEPSDTEARLNRLEQERDRLEGRLRSMAPGDEAEALAAVLGRLDRVCGIRPAWLALKPRRLEG